MAGGNGFTGTASGGGTTVKMDLNIANTSDIPFVPTAPVNLPAGTPGDAYPAGSVFYEPGTGAPAAFVIDNGATGNLEVSISEWDRYHPGQAPPANSAIQYPSSPTPVEDFFPSRFDGTNWYDAQGTIVSMTAPYHALYPGGVGAPGSMTPGAAGDWQNPNSPDYNPGPVY